ncbi:mycofactocin biosynthesis chaperone MftB [Euzebya tangerina]|uniref:mycofactocin biosynthesis chaperone MftB n=1 Tax=Euzebya tangerina TaxID=591198 RepID=UPI0039C895A7
MRRLLSAGHHPVPFDLDSGWRLHESVSLRPEPFGALAYHFGTRRLSFLKDLTLLEVVRTLADHPTARQACTAAGVDTARLPAFTAALGTLAESHMITATDPTTTDTTTTDPTTCERTSR